MPPSELSKIQDGPKYFDQRNSPFSLGAVRELRKLPWLEFCCIHHQPATTGECGTPQPEAPLHGSCPHLQSRTVIKLLLPSGVGSEPQTAVRMEVRRRWSSLCSLVLMGAGSPHLRVVPSHWPKWSGPETNGQALCPSQLSQVSSPGNWGNPAWVGKAKWNFSQTLMFPGLGPYLCFL